VRHQDALFAVVCSLLPEKEQKVEQKKSHHFSPPERTPAHLRDGRLGLEEDPDPNAAVVRSGPIDARVETVEPELGELV